LSLKKKLFIFGLGSTARMIYTFVSRYELFDVVGFVVDSDYKTVDTFCNLPVIGYHHGQDISGLNKSDDLIFVAIQWNRVNEERKQVYKKLKQQGFSFANIVSPNAILHGQLEGDNCWICDMAVIDVNAKIQSNVFVKTKAYVGNDTRIENHAFVGANSFVAGSCTVKEQSFIGVSATVFDGVTVGQKSVVGAGSLINRNIPNFSLVKSTSILNIKEYSAEDIETKLISSNNVR